MVIRFRPCSENGVQDDGEIFHPPISHTLYTSLGSASRALDVQRPVKEVLKQTIIAAFHLDESREEKLSVLVILNLDLHF